MNFRNCSTPLLQPPLSSQELAIRDALRTHVDVLANLIGERNSRVWSALDAAAAYIERSLRDAGYEPHIHPYAADGSIFRNIDAELIGNAQPDEIVLLGAHYDTVMFCPGANDNATGIAAVLEIARLLKSEALARTVRFVAFANEEPPFFRTDCMGSRVYARECRERHEHIVAMLCPETIGCYSDSRGTQRYPIPMPFPFSLMYHDRGDFIMFVGNLLSSILVRKCRRLFRRSCEFSCKGIAAPARIPGVGFSDHWSFWQEGYRAVMITDTAPYRYRYYHTPQDTPDKIDYDRTARVILGLSHVVAKLAGLK